MKHIVKGIALLVVALAATSAQAIPTLSFNGTIDYSATSQQLHVDATLFEITSVPGAIEINNSALIFDATFNDDFITTTCNWFTCTQSIAGNFTGNANPGIDDLTIYDGDGTTLLLAANFQSLTLEGGIGSTNGAINGVLEATDGTLMSLFSDSDLFALVLNLDPIEFSDTMFSNDFSGQVNGDVTARAVPEPTILALLGFGILIVGFSNIKKHTI